MASIKVDAGMEEYRNAQREKWKKEKSPQPERKISPPSKSTSTASTTHYLPAQTHSLPQSHDALPTTITSPSPGFQLVHNIVKAWRTSYVYSIHLISATPTTEKYLTIWSKPTPTTPIPEHTANIYFTVTMDPTNKLSVEYLVENSRFIHTPNDKIVFTEQWLDEIVRGKIIAKLICGRSIEAED